MTFDEAVDELYGAPLEDFVATRGRLAKEVGGDEGKELAKLRKPTVAAWALNQLARHARRDVDLLLDAGHRMRRAGADREAFEHAKAQERDALRRLTRAAAGLGVSAAAVDAVVAALRAAAVGPQGRELLARGRFVELPTATGFEAYAGVELPERRPARAAAKPRRPARPGPDDRELRAAEAALREAELKLRAAEAEADAARRRLEQLRRR